MFRQSILRAPTRFNTSAIATRSFSMASVRAAEGDTGAPRSGGTASGDAFTKRESAEEARFVRQAEKEKLLALKKKLQDQKQHLEELDKHIDELTKEQGGEHN